MSARIARLIAVFDQLPVGVIVADASSGAVTLVNQRAREILDHPIGPDDRPANFFEAYSFHANGRPYDHDRHPFTRALRHGEVVAGEELYYVTGAGSRVILSVIAAPLRDASSRIV